MEVELIALDSICSKAKWLQNLLRDITLCMPYMTTISIHCDNKATTKFSKKKNSNDKLSRHFRLRQKSILNYLKYKVVSIDYVKFIFNLADYFTKGLSRNMILESSRKIGVSP